MGCGVGFCAHIEAEPVPAQVGPPRQCQLPTLGVNRRDLCLHKGHPRQQAKAAQVDGAGGWLIKTGD